MRHERLDKRLIFVTGKGGTGKTIVSAALGLIAARQGKRTMVCEVAEQSRVPNLFGRDGAGFEEVELAENLWAISVDPEHAREEWLRFQLRSGALAGVLNSSRIFSYLAAAAPGLSELVTVGKVWELAQLERKTVQGLALRRGDRRRAGHRPRRGDAARAQDLPRRRARRARSPARPASIHNFLADPEQTAVVAVALAEDMPVNETLDLGDRLKEEMGQHLQADRGQRGLPRALQRRRGRGHRRRERQAVGRGPRRAGGRAVRARARPGAAQPAAAPAGATPTLR